MDPHGYPDDAELKQIAEWPHADFVGLMEYVRARWRYAEDDFQKDGTHIYLLFTGGWSGNESIIGALQDNQMFWLLCWQESRRGGHYKFNLPTIKSIQTWNG